MRGSGCSTASSAEANDLSGSYSTLMRSRAAVAVSSLVAATAATGSPMNRTRSTHSACSSWETGRIPNGIGRSRPVRTACTPSSFAAADASTETMRACGCVLRSSLQYSIRGNVRSSAKRVAPVTFATASTLRRAFPMTLCMLHPLRGQFDRFINLDIAGAAAQVAGERVLDFCTCRLGIGGEQCLGGEEKGGRAVAALRRAQIGECLLQRMQLPALRHALDRAHPVAGARQAEHQAGKDRRSIQQHRAGAAFPQLAAVLRAGESQIFAQHFEQRLVRREGYFLALTIHLEGDRGHDVILIRG